MLSNYRVAITCADITLLQRLAGLLQESWCRIAEENGEYYWSSSLFETSLNGSEVAKKADQYLPALNGLVKLHIATTSKIARGNKILFTNESGGTGGYFDGTISIPWLFKIDTSEEELEQIRQRWTTLVKVWTEQGTNPSDALNNALTHFGEEVSWNSLYNVYETIRKAYNYSRGVTNKKNYTSLPEKWTVINGRNREKDFTESANNAYISGVVSARHSLAASDRAEKIEGSSFVEIIKSNGKKEYILPMSLNEAKEFISFILDQWILSNQISA